MKYCKNCGMLLEDTHEHCIRCGTDVTLPENVSMYPIEVMETIEEENQRKKATGKIVAMIIGLVVVLAGLIIFFLFGMGGADLMMQAALNATGASEPAMEFEEEEFAEEVYEPEEAEEPEEPEPTPAPSDRKVKDDEGKYYDYVTEKDDAGNVVFTAVVPQELKNRDFYNNYEECDDRYPYTVNFTACTEENDVRFTYLSPRKLWYKISETGKSRSDERDITHYMSYFKYDGPRSYLEPLLAQSYPGAKFEMIEEYDVSDLAVSRLESLAKEKNKELFGDIGNYAHIGENTTYANMDYEFSAKVYKYEITLKDKDMLFCKYYVPSMAHNLTYADTDKNDRGTVTEWYNFAIICFETGNEDDYDDYEEDFNLFIANALPTKLFMYINETYAKDIKKAVEDNTSADPLDQAMLSKIAGQYSPSVQLDDFDEKVMGILTAASPVAFTGDDCAVYTNDSINVAFLDKENGKVFISKAEDEYPGDSYEELTKQEAESSPAQPSDDEQEPGDNDDAGIDAAPAAVSEDTEETT